MALAAMCKCVVNIHHSKLSFKSVSFGKAYLINTAAL